MGHLQQGAWRTGAVDTSRTGGEYIRAASQFRDWITTDGSSRFPAESGRYHLYVSLACPWAHRTLIFRKLKQLEAVISVTEVEPVNHDQGWEFGTEHGGQTDPLYGARYLHELYARARPDYSGRVTVPMLWDKRSNTIVNNESSEIIRLLNSAFNAYTSVREDYYPARLRAEIDEVNAWVYDDINNGAYRAGFAGNQAVYEAAIKRLFGALDRLERRLSTHRYLVGNTITEADWRLFPTLIRFDAVYVTHFKCNLRRIEDYPNIANYVRDLYQAPGVAETVNFDHIKRHYFMSHPQLNPSRLVPVGPLLDFSRPHDRARFISDPVG